MNKRRRFKAKRRRLDAWYLARHRMMSPRRQLVTLKFHRDAFSTVWAMPKRMDELFGFARIQPLEDGRVLLPHEREANPDPALGNYLLTVRHERRPAE